MTVNPTLDERMQAIESQLEALNHQMAERVVELISRVDTLERLVDKLNIALAGVKSDLLPIAPWMGQANCKRCGRKIPNGKNSCKYCQTTV